MLSYQPASNTGSPSKQTWSVNPSNGNNPLHEAIINGEYYLHFYLALKDYTELAKAKMAVSWNDSLLLPSDYLRTSKFNLQDQTRIANQLCVYISKFDLPPLTMQLSMQNIFLNDFNVDIAGLNYHLALACNAVNLSRQIIPHSASHTQSNYLASDKRTQLQDELTSMRVFGQTSYRKECMSKVNYLMFMMIYLHIVRTGNCNEYSYLVLHDLIMQDPTLSAEIIEIDNGDHTVVVIEKGEGNDSNKPYTWNKSAVLADGWAGIAAPAHGSHLERNLKDRFKIVHPNEMIYNGIMNFNPAIHRLKSIFQLDLNERQLYAQRMQNFNERYDFKIELEKIFASNYKVKEALITTLEILIQVGGEWHFVRNFLSVIALEMLSMDKEIFLNIVYAKGTIEIASYLISKNILNLNRLDTKGRTPLHRVVKFGNGELTQFFLESGVDQNIKSAANKTAYDKAVHKNFLPILSIFAEHNRKQIPPETIQPHATNSAGFSN